MSTATRKAAPATAAAACPAPAGRDSPAGDDVPRPEVLVLGIGNILLRDEGAGVRAVEALADRTLPESVELLDGGTMGFELIEQIAGRRRLIVIDALAGGERPGTIYRLTGADLAGPEMPLSVHNMGLADLLSAAEQLGCAPAEVVIFGIEPAVVDWGLELTPTLQAALPRLLELVLAEATR